MDMQLRVIVFLSFIGFAAAITCYDCVYVNKNPQLGQKNCDEGENFSEVNITKKTCSGQCQKKIVTKEGDDEDYVIYRTCANECETSDRHGIDCCDSDLCNAASPSAVYSFAFVVLFSVLAYIV